MSIQPEAKLKRKLREGFEAVTGGPKGPNAFCTALVASLGQKPGLPDQFFAVGGRSVWIESKVEPNDLSDIQRHTIGRMVRAGAKVRVLTFHASKTVFVRTPLPDGTIPDAVAVFNTKDMKTNLFWDYVLGVHRVS